MTEVRRAGRHSAAAATPATQAPDEVEPDEVWVPPPFEPVRPGDFIEYSSGTFQVRRSHRGLIFVLCLLLVAAAGGSWWYYQRTRADAPVDPVRACQAENAGAASVTGSMVHVEAGGRIPAGVPVPTEPVWVACRWTSTTGTSGETVVWRSDLRTDYEGLLTAAGWVPTPGIDDVTRWINGTDSHLIVTTTVDHKLVAYYPD